MSGVGAGDGGEGGSARGAHREDGVDGRVVELDAGDGEGDGGRAGQANLEVVGAGVDRSVGANAFLNETFEKMTGPPLTAMSTAGASGEAWTKRTCALPAAGLALLSVRTRGSMVASLPTATTV